jgi:hypothetical protein
MKFTLKPYQSDAVDDLVRMLERARKLHRDDKVDTSVSLSATTGAGKTVMAAAVIEALFWGSETFDVQPDPGAVVIWFSDDPNLNEQTKDRLRQASEKFTYDQLVTIEPPFARPQLDPHKVYFLNTQKLSKSSLLTRGHQADDAPQLETMTREIRPDLQGWTIWETIGNTIDDDDLTVYLILDEAHRGFNTKTTRDKPTIVRRLVNGHAGHPPVPIVWGISATIDRFKEAMADADADASRRALPAVQVDPARVQESGLVKDTIVLDIPNEAGNFDMVLVRRAAEKLRDSSMRWERYAQSQALAHVVKPLLVLQAPNTPDTDQIGSALDEILRVMPDLTGESVRHVLGDHSVQKFGTWEVEWIEPQRVEERTSVRVLVAKDAISTGWDCPRAEVMVSFRPAKDQTHITQLLGRMVRNPLARRVPGDERLNSVDCILPFFDRTTAGKVAKFLSGAIDEIPGDTGKKVLLDGRELRTNGGVPSAVWEAWDAIPTETLPRRGARPVKRLVALAQALSADGVRPGALAEVETTMHAVLDSLAVRHKGEFETAIEEVWAVRGMTISGSKKTGKLTYSDFVERADDRAIRVAFEDAKKAFGADVAQSYVNHLASDDDDDDGLREAFVKVSALAIVPKVREAVDREADQLTEKWFAQHRVTIKELPDERQQAFEEIRAEATEPMRGELKRPRTRMEDFAVVLDDGQTTVAPVAKRHLMSDDDGEFPLSSLNEWEYEVVSAELARDSSRAWYRNPPRASVDSLGVSYRDPVGNWRSMHPDFIFFNEVGDDIVVSIVDPHGHHLEDSLIKLQALARFAKDYGTSFHRIEALAKIGNQMRVLDLQDDAVRAGIQTSDKAPLELYNSELAVDYDAAGK